MNKKDKLDDYIELALSLGFIVGIVVLMIWASINNSNKKHQDNIVLVRFDIGDNVALLNNCNCLENIEFKKSEYSGKDSVFLNCTYTYNVLIYDKDKKLIKELNFQPKRYGENLIEIDGPWNKYKKIPPSKE